MILSINTTWGNSDSNNNNHSNNNSSNSRNSNNSNSNNNNNSNNNMIKRIREITDFLKQFWLFFSSNRNQY